MSRRNKWVLTLMLLLGIAIFAFSLRDIKFSVLVNDFVHINFWWFGVAILCMVLYLGLEALIVKVFISDRIEGFTFKDALRIPMVEQLFNGITPFSSGGQPAQLIALMQTGVDAGKASSVLLNWQGQFGAPDEVCRLPIDDCHQLFDCPGHWV